MKTRLILLIILSIVFHLNAQDRHYWDQAVGGRTALLGGIAIGGVDDYSATFYNPGALSFLNKNKMSFSFNMYGIKDFKFVDGGGPGIDSRYTRVSLFPSSLAGSLPFLGDSTNRFSYMIYSNGYSYVRISERFEGYRDIIPERPISIGGSEKLFEGEEFLINQGKLDALLQEVTIGFGYAKKVSDNVGVGVSLLGAYRDQTKIRYESYSAFDTTSQQTASTEIFVDNDFWAVRFSGKIGVSVVLEDLKFGFTFTTPSIALKLASGGTDGASLTSNDVYVIIDTLNNQIISGDILASDRQEGLPVDYRSPLSFGGGIEYTFSEDTKAHMAFEWFAPLSTHVVMQPDHDNFIRNDPESLRPIDSAELLKVYDAMKGIINVGLALEHRLTDKLIGFAAFRTDFSNADFENIDGLALGFTDFNIYHFTLGTSINLGDTNVGVGFEYSHATRDDFRQIFNFPSGSSQPGDIVIYGYRGTSTALYNNFNIFFGITQVL